MSIQITNPVRIAGVEQTIGTQLSLDPSLEADLVTRKCAIYLVIPDHGVDPVIRSALNLATGAQITSTWTGTKAQYDAIAVKDANTQYVTDAGIYVGDSLVGVGATIDPVTGGIRYTTPSGGLQRVLGPRKWALLGDSIASANTSAVGGNVYYRQTGWLCWAMARLGWPADMQVSDNYAIGGTTTDVMVANQLPALRAGHAVNNYERVFISSGTNDSNAGRSFSDWTNDTLRLIAGICEMGIVPAHIGVLPKGTSGGMTDAKRQNLRFNDWLANYAAKTGCLEFLQGCHESVADNSTSNGYIIAGCSDDQLHPNDLGGFNIGEQIYQYYKSMGLPSALQFSQSQADQYNATYNTSGVIFDSPNPLLTGGTTAPTGMTTAGTNCTWAVGTRTLANGQSRPTVGCTVSGATSNGYLYDDNVASGAWDVEEIAEGDYVYAQAVVEVTTGGSGILPYLSMAENNGVNSTEAACLKRSSVDVGTIPSGTILTLRTPNLPARAYGGSGNASFFAKLNVYSPAASGLITVRAFEMRKVVS